jgi:hypothetical protein
MYLKILARWGQAHQFRQLFFLQHQPLHWNNVKYIKLHGRYHESVSQACRYGAYGLDLDSENGLYPNRHPEPDSRVAKFRIRIKLNVPFSFPK